MEFELLLRAAQYGDVLAEEKIFRTYRPLLIKFSMDRENFDEDLYQELSAAILNCIRKFKI